MAVDEVVAAEWTAVVIPVLRLGYERETVLIKCLKFTLLQ